MFKILVGSGRVEKSLSVYNKHETRLGKRPVMGRGSIGRTPSPRDHLPASCCGHKLLSGDRLDGHHVSTPHGPFSFDQPLRMSALNKLSHITFVPRIGAETQDDSILSR